MKYSSGLQFDHDYSPPLKGVMITEKGTLFLQCVNGTVMQVPIDKTRLPYRLITPIARIRGNGSGAIGDGSTGTDIPLNRIYRMR